jgi:hypothetical protein
MQEKKRKDRKSKEEMQEENNKMKRARKRRELGVVREKMCKNTRTSIGVGQGKRAMKQGDKRRRWLQHSHTDRSRRSMLRGIDKRREREAYLPPMRLNDKAAIVSKSIMSLSNQASIDIASTASAQQALSIALMMPLRLNSNMSKQIAEVSAATEDDDVSRSGLVEDQSCRASRQNQSSETRLL